MRPTLWVVASVAASFLMAAPGWSRQNQQKTQNQQQTTAAQNQNGGQAQGATAPADPLAEAARKARERRKESPKAAKVFTNDNIPTTGGISAVGSEPAASSPNAATASAAKSSGNAAAGNDEKTWRARFADLRHKLQQDQAELDVMQRELGVLNVQYYSDPNKEMQQQLSREDIDKKTAAIEAKKKDVAADEQAISDAEDDLRKAGGDPGWAGE